MNNNKKISVIMGVYNCESTIKESIDSILNQTYQEFVIIICDDGSTDNTYKIIENYYNKYPDKFILLKNNENMGLNHTLNVCLKYAEGEYIARMDGDDISLPDRFEKQVRFLDNNQDCHIVSSAMIYFDESGDWGRSKPEEWPNKNNFIKRTPFAHAPSMVRKTSFDIVQGYTVDDKLLRVEDYHLWMKMYKYGFKGHNILEPLYKMRDDMNAIKRRNTKNRLNEIYLKLNAIKELRLSKKNYIYILKPALLIITPSFIYRKLHKAKLKKVIK